MKQKRGNKKQGARKTKREVGKGEGASHTKQTKGVRRNEQRRHSRGEEAREIEQTRRSRRESVNERKQSQVPTSWYVRERKSALQR